VRHINGGNFLTTLKNKLIDIWHRIQPYAKTAFDIGKSITPYVAPLLGLGEGEGEGEGGVSAYGVRAGARMRRSTLKHRMH
jgi:hypothetical protein